MNTPLVNRRQLALGTAASIGAISVPGFAPSQTAVAQQSLVWELIAPTGETPAARWDHTLAVFDDERTLIAFGGRDASGASFADTWSYSRSENSWSLIDATGPSARFGHAIAVDQAAGIMYLFGGQFGDLFFNDLWQFSIADKSWTLVSDGAGVAPTPRYGTSMALDEASELIVSHGFTFAGRFNDTWSWSINSGSWSEISPTNDVDRPLNRCLHEAIWSEADQAMLLYGGCSSGYGPCPQGDLWRFDAETSTWVLIQPTDAPSARMNPGLAFDRGRSQTVLFGGLTESGYDNSLWVLETGENPTWRFVATGEITPAPRASHDMCVTGPNLYLFGGYTDAGPTNDLWLARLG